MYESHMHVLESTNNKGKMAELTFVRNVTSYLFECALHSFVLMHLPYLPKAVVKFLSLQVLSLVT